MSNEVQQAIAQALKAIRSSSDLTQAEVAEVLGTTRVTVARWENGTRTPSPDDLANLAVVYSQFGTDTSPADFYPKQKALRAAVPDDVKDRARRLGRDINRRHFGGRR